MNAVARADLDREPVPVSEGYPAEPGVQFDGSAWRTYWLVGTAKHPFGPAYPSAREAIAASRYLRGRLHGGSA